MDAEGSETVLTPFTLGNSKETYDVLVPVYDWFTEGFDTADLKAAKALLEELR